MFNSKDAKPAAKAVEKQGESDRCKHFKGGIECVKAYSKALEECDHTKAEELRREFRLHNVRFLSGLTDLDMVTLIRCHMAMDAVLRSEMGPWRHAAIDSLLDAEVERYRLMLKDCC